MSFIKQKSIQLLLLIFIPVIAVSQQAKVDTIRVFYLGGQSNMDGYGYSKDLPNSLDKTNKDVFIFHGNPVGDNQTNGGVGKWEELKPGHGTKFSTDGVNNKLTNRFGVEISFAKKIQELYPNEKIAIIKYSKGGTSIDSTAGQYAGCWEPDYRTGAGINQYDHCLATIDNAFRTKDINGDGIEDYLLPTGIIWMQGESDGNNEAVALRYYSNLKRLMELIRASLHDGDLPIVLGKISDSWNDKDGKVWDFGELVQYAQEKYARTDKNTDIVRTTRYYKYTDKWHYDSEGYIDLGEKFAEAIYQLNQIQK